jgi:PAS domain S-box-containing protein
MKLWALEPAYTGSAMADKPIPLLLVDDHPENITALKALLAEMPFTFDLVEAGSGNEALRQSLKVEFALILLDVQMPGMTGLETATLLRANPKTRHFPIIFITAGAHDAAHMFKGYDAGAVDYLVKPIEPLVLQGKVRVFCELYLQRRELDRTEELRTLADELAESEARVRTIIDSAYEAFVGIDGNGVVLDWNRRAETVFGWARAEAVGCTVAELIIPERYRKAHAAGMRHFLATGNGPVLNRCIEISALNREGNEFPVELSIWQIPNTKQPMFGAFLRDVTERKRTEAELQQLNEKLEQRVEERTCELRRAMDQIMESEKLASLGSIVAGVAHELNTPIGNMMLTASTLTQNIEEIQAAVAQNKLGRRTLDAFLDDCANATKVMVRGAERANTLISSFKQIAVDQTSQRQRTFDLRELVADTLNTLGTAMRHAKVDSSTDIPPGIVMNSCPGDLEQIFTNLITNSIRHGFSDRPSGKIGIAARQYDEMVEIIYCDDGVGIAPDLHRKVFEPFYTTKLGQGGSGLGMFIVHNLVHGSLKGDIRIESDAGKGVVFSMHLPLNTPA